MNHLEQILHDRYGWDCRHLHQPVLPDPGGVSAPDLQALVESMVVPETWFFRDTEPFVYLARHVRAVRPPGCAAVWRVLSVPCSSGEEPYSIVMALREAGVPAELIAVDALDVSERLLTAARAAVYKDRSFREPDGGWRDKYCLPAGPGSWTVSDEIKNRVRFIRANALALDDCAGLTAAYQVVFCRNLLIYQHAAARLRLIAQLDRRLAEDGLLFVGHAEMLPVFEQQYRPVEYRGAFAYCKRRPLPQPAPLPVPTVADRSGGRSPAWNVDRPPAPKPVTAESAPPAPVAPPSLARARQLADAGRLPEAEALCESVLHAQPLCAEAHLLLGVIRGADGREQAAETCLQRALYLDAGCREALLHLAALKEQRGDRQRAGVLRRRMNQGASA